MINAILKKYLNILIFVYMQSQGRISLLQVKRITPIKIIPNYFGYKGQAPTVGTPHATPT